MVFNENKWTKREKNEKKRIKKIYTESDFVLLYDCFLGDVFLFLFTRMYRATHGQGWRRVPGAAGKILVGGSTEINEYIYIF